MLKRIFIALGSSILLSSTLAQTTIKGSIEETDTKGKLYLYEYKGFHSELLDSASINKGKFTFKGKYNPGQYQLKFDNHAIQIIVEGKTLSINLKSSPTIRVKDINGSQGTFEYQFYKKHNDSFDFQAQELNKKASQYNYLRQTDPQEYNKRINVLRKGWDSLQTSHNLYIANLAKSATSTLIKDVAKMLEINDTNNSKETYLTKEDFTDERFSRGEFLSRKINTYFIQLAQLNPQNYEIELDHLLSYTTTNNLSKEVVYQIVIPTAASFDKKKSKLYAKSYVGDYPNSLYAQEWLKSFPVGVGDQYKEIVSLAPDRETTHKLSDLKGKVILLDFWASWCGPCISEMPNVVNAYNKYHEQGFEVFSVSLDGDVGRWKNAINRFNMVWPYHVSSLKKWKSPAAQAYGVTGIPFTMLIDENGTIISKGLRGPALDQKLEEVFAK